MSGRPRSYERGRGGGQAHDARKSRGGQRGQAPQKPLYRSQSAASTAMESICPTCASDAEIQVGGRTLQLLVSADRAGWWFATAAQSLAYQEYMQRHSSRKYTPDANFIFEEKETPAMVTGHPALLMKSRNGRKWRELRELEPPDKYIAPQGAYSG